MPDETAEPTLVMRLDFNDGHRLGRGKIQLLENIRIHGSISAGGRAMDMSYRRAWMLVDEMNRMFHEPVVVTQRGGKEGGHAAVTPSVRTSSLASGQWRSKRDWQSTAIWSG